MWWFRYKRIIDYLDKSNDSLNKKEILISKKEDKIKEEISKLQDQELIYFLFDSKIPNKIKKIIFSKIDEIFNSSYTKDRMFSIVKYIQIRKPSLKTLKELYKEYGKNSITSLIANELYTEDLTELILDKKRTIEDKKMIIELKFNSTDICILLEKLDTLILLQKNVNEYKELIDFITSINLYDKYDIGDIIRSEKVSKDIKIELLKKQINISNIVGVLSLYAIPNEVKETIYDLKRNIIDEYIKNLNEKTIIEYYDGFDKEEKLSYLIFERQKDLLIKIIKNTNSKDLYRLIYKTRYQKIADLLFELREQDFINSLDTIDHYKILSILNDEYVRDSYKKTLFNKRKKEIEKEIQKTNGHELVKILKSLYSPNFLKEFILENRASAIIEEIKTIKEEDVRTELFIYGVFNAYYEPYVKLVIELKVNENNIYELLKSANYYVDEAKNIIKYKNAFFREKLKNIEFDKLIKKNSEIKSEIIDYIFLLNKDIIDEIIKKENFDISDIGVLILKNDLSIEIKKSLLRTHSINEEDLNSIIELIKAFNSVLVMKRYNDIKTFIESLNVSFKSFMQYGSGSVKYKSWLTKVLDIIDNNKNKEFLEVCNYFFKNYYYEDDSKENDVYIIKNLQEILYNYYNYHELCMLLTTNNIELNSNLKQDLRHLFNSLPQNNINTLEDLKNFRKSSYLASKKDLDNSNNLSMPTIKNMFNNIFGNTDIISNIGGSDGLEKLKIYNKNNRFICAYIDEILKYVRIIELVKYSNDKNSLIETLKYLYEGDFEDFTNMQNEFSNLSKKIQHLYELDSKINLTNIEESTKIDGVINEELSKEYGGKVLDFKDKNYCLYAHILSYNENIESLLKGESSGSNNFISLSPISYLGQKYYYNYNKMIFLFDEIKNGSFICSSLYNFGSNRLIKENSSEVEGRTLLQKGILETSSVTENNAEALFYREGLIPKAIALPGGRKPTKEELLYHKKYNLPFVITQELNSPIENVKYVFSHNSKYIEPITRNEKIERILELLSPKINIIKETSEYTGREIGLFTDSHALFEPTSAVLEDMRKHGITEIYSLGDNVGSGPSPDEIIDMLDYYKVSSIMGNSEYYNTLGTGQFTYLDDNRLRNQEWTKDKLGSKRIEKMRLWTPSIDLVVGGKKIALCHFANDIRWDFSDNSTWSYQEKFEEGKNSKQFLYTNSEEAKRKIQNKIASNKKDIESIRGLLDAQKHPIFNGKKVTDYDAIIQGHVHFDMKDTLNNTSIHTLRACGMGYGSDKKDQACYYILKERKDGGFDIVKKLVPFNRNMLISNIKSSNVPNKELVLRWTN